MDDRLWCEWIAHKLPVPKFLWFSWTRWRLLASYPSEHSSSNGSPGTNHSNSDHILFRMEGIYSPSFYVLAGSRIFVTQNVDYIINRYCENTIGSDFIQRGEYRIIRAHDNTVIERSKFAGTVRPETKFEISIVMRQTKKFTKQCPQCGNSNYNVSVICGWIKW